MFLYDINLCYGSNAYYNKYMIFLDEYKKVDHTSIELFVNVDNLKLVNPEIMEDNQNGKEEITDLRSHIPTILIW